MNLRTKTSYNKNTMIRHGFDIDGAYSTILSSNFLDARRAGPESMCCDIFCEKLNRDCVWCANNSLKTTISTPKESATAAQKIAMLRTHKTKKLSNALNSGSGVPHRQSKMAGHELRLLGEVW